MNGYCSPQHALLLELQELGWAQPLASGEPLPEALDLAKQPSGSRHRRQPARGVGRRRGRRAIGGSSHQDLLIEGTPRCQGAPGSLAVRPSPRMEPAIGPQLDRGAAGGAQNDTAPVEGLELHVNAESLPSVCAEQAVQARLGGSSRVPPILPAVRRARGCDDRDAPGTRRMQRVDQVHQGFALPRFRQVRFEHHGRHKVSQPSSEDAAPIPPQRIPRDGDEVQDPSAWCLRLRRMVLLMSVIMKTCMLPRRCSTGCSTDSFWVP